MNSTMFDRATRTLQGLAIGDAMGMPTQSLSRDRIAAQFGLIAGFADSDADQPIAPNLPAGTITDDTEQALLLADIMIAGKGAIDPVSYARALGEWDQSMRARGSRDLLGPSTKLAIDAIGLGVDPRLAGKTGTTNGAAMRIAPVGIAVPCDDLERLVDKVEESALISHHTSLGISSAAAVAAAVSAGVAGAGLDIAIQRAVAAARIGARRGAWIAGGSIAERIGHACGLVGNLDGDALIAIIHDVIGTSVASQESVVAAFALVWRFRDRPEMALRYAASVGGDTDTIAAIAGAVLGATAVSPPWSDRLVQTVETVNRLDLASVAKDLLVLRVHWNSTT